MNSTKKKNIEDCRLLAEQRGGRCLSEEYVNCDIKMLWECEKKHIFEARYRHVKYEKSWCPECAENKQKTIEDCRKLAENRGGKCLSEVYKNAQTKMLWECGKLHQWWAVYNNIQQGKWCVFCAGRAKHTLEDCRQLAESKGGKCLSDVYINAKTKIKWECANKHRWEAIYTAIQQGEWCPECSLGKSQKKLFKIIRNIFSNLTIKYNYRGFGWLKKHNKLELDIFIPDLRIAIEYDGEQHFKPVRFGDYSFEEAENKLKKLQYSDKLKNKLISEHPEDIKHFIRISYQEKITYKNIISILQKNNIPVDF